MIDLIPSEELASRIVMLRGHRVMLDVDLAHNVKHASKAFTEHGAITLAAVLNSPVAIAASIQVVRAFVRLRAMAAMHEELADKLQALESRFDEQFGIVFDAIRQLMKPAPSPARIGFRASSDSHTHADRANDADADWNRDAEGER